jgi:hypothetical protein
VVVTVSLWYRTVTYVVAVKPTNIAGGTLKFKPYQEFFRLYKFIVIIITTIMLFTLMGCSSKSDVIRVKCPACGYEFDVQPEG